MSDDFTAGLTRIRALVLLDLAASASAIEWAAMALSQGHEAHGLVELATLGDPRREDVLTALEAMADECGLEPMTELVAGTTAATLEARELLEGSTTPIAAARRICRIYSLAPSTEGYLWDFVGLESLWEDDAPHRRSLEESIRSEARRLVAESEFSDSVQDHLD